MQKEIDKIYERIDKVEEKFDFAADRKIDVNNLHTELQNQPGMGFKYNRRRAKLSAVVKDLEELKKQTRSQLINNCVAKPKLCDPDSATPKYTVGKAEAYYRLDSGYIEVIDALLNATYEHDVTEGMQRIIEDRKWLLKDLVALSMSQYFESSESKETRIVEDAQFNEMDKTYGPGSEEKKQPKKEEKQPVKTTQTKTEPVAETNTRRIRRKR